MKRQPWTVGIVGAGTIFESHRDAYQKIGLCVRAVADVNQERVKLATSQNKIPLVTTDWRELLDRKDIDLIDICTPPKFHREMVIAALQAGRDVICEKPLAPNLREIDEILEVEKKSTGSLTVVHQTRFEPVYQRLKWLTESGLLGKISIARCVRFDNPYPHLIEMGVWGNWALYGGGVLMTKAIHQLDLLLWILGRARRVQAMMDTLQLPIESEDRVVANIEFENGCLANLCVSTDPDNSKQFRSELELLGEKGVASAPWFLSLNDKSIEKNIRLKLDLLFPLPRYPEKGWKWIFGAVAFKLGQLRGKNFESPHTLFLRDFTSALENGRRISVSAEQARNAVELCTAIYASAIHHEIVHLPLDSSHPFYAGINKSDYKS